LNNVLLCGLDEAGRGPLAGPVYAAAVILPEKFPVEFLNDSKKLSAKARERARVIICGESLAWGIGWVTAAEIDEINIHRASLLAMKRAFEAMVWTEAGKICREPHESLRTNEDLKAKNCGNIRAVADGLFVPDISVPCEAMVKADSRVHAVMAASILAKTARDRLMEYYGLFCPEYGYEKHKGYPTKAHKEAIARWGPSPIQRMSFNWR